MLLHRLAALQEKRIKGAALDVFETEPLPKDSPLYDLHNCLLSPHCADRTARSASLPFLVKSPDPCQFLHFGRTTCTAVLAWI